MMNMGIKSFNFLHKSNIKPDENALQDVYKQKPLYLLIIKTHSI